MNDLRTHLQQAGETLSTISATPTLDAQLLLAHVLQISRTKLLALDYRMPLADECVAAYQQLITKRVAGYPVAYLVAYQEFYGRAFFVDERVLIPRADTEVLVEAVLAYMQAHPEVVSVREVGFGSGAISLTLGCELVDKQVCASDISLDAYEVFRVNYASLKTQLRSEVKFFVGDLWTDEYVSEVLVSNLPYLTKKECQERIEAKWREPMLALNGQLRDNDAGLGLINKLIIQAKERVRAIFLEASAEQMWLIEQTLLENGFSNIAIINDLAGQQRVIIGHKL